MTAISATIIPDAEAFLRENLADMAVDEISAVRRTALYERDLSAVYHDEEENHSIGVSKQDHIDALSKLVELVSEKKLFVGGITNPADLADLSNWDVEVVDAYFQLIFHGEVIYG